MNSSAARKRAIENGVDNALQRIARGASRRPMVLAGVENPHTRNRVDRYRECGVCGKRTKGRFCGNCSVREKT